MNPDKQMRYLEQEGLPAAVETERAILGAMMLDKTMTAFNTAASQIQPEDFTLDAHRRIYRGMIECANEGATPDSTLLVEKLGGIPGLAQIGGASYLFGLTDGVPRVKNIEQYVKVVREKSRARMLLAMFESGAAQIRERESADDVLAETQQQIINIVQHGRTGRTPEIDQIVAESLVELRAIRESTGECVGLSTGMDQLDELTTGYRDSEFYIIGARPGQGKTAFACQAIRRNCLAGRRCALFSIEVKRTQIINRLIAMESGYGVFDLRDPRRLDDEDMTRIALAGSNIATWPLQIEDAPSLDIRELQAIARMFVSRGAEIIFVDYLQKLKAPGKDRFEKVTAVANALWELGRSTGVPVVALSQLKRKQTQGDEPTMDDLRESGEIEQNANGVFLLHRPTAVDNSTAEKKRKFTGEDKIIIAKQRSGPSEISLPVLFKGKSGMFVPRTGESA